MTPVMIQQSAFWKKKRLLSWQIVLMCRHQASMSSARQWRQKWISLIDQEPDVTKLHSNCKTCLQSACSPMVSDIYPVHYLPAPLHPIYHHPSPPQPNHSYPPPSRHPHHPYPHQNTPITPTPTPSPLPQTHHPYPTSITPTPSPSPPPTPPHTPPVAPEPPVPLVSNP